MRTLQPFSTTALCLALASLAQGQAKELLTGGPDTLIRRGSAVTSAFDVIGACGGIVASMDSTGDTTWIGDAGGTVYAYTPQLGVQYVFQSMVDADAIAAIGNDVFVGGQNGALARYDGTTFVLEDIIRAPGPIHALTIVGPWIYVGDEDGRVSRTSLDFAIDFETVSHCGCDLAGLASDGSRLFVASSAGFIDVVDLATFDAVNTFQVASSAVAVDLHLGQLLVATDDQRIIRAHAFDGTVHDVYTLASPIAALTMTEGDLPAFTYCYGHSCPCGNDDANGGCVNSTGRGARIDAAGSSSVSADDLALIITDMPANAASILIMSADSNWAVLGDGWLCVGGNNPIHRFGATSANGFGTVLHQDVVDYAATNFGPTAQINSGSTWHFQLWFRDNAGPCGAGFNTTNSASVQFTP